MPKKERAKAKGGARAAAPIRAVPLAAALAAALLFGLWSMRRGCTDVSALNFAPAATADDGTCVGGMHDLSGAFEFQTVAAAAPKQLDAIGIEFEANRAQNLVVLTKVIPGSAAAANGAREGDELLALRGTSATVLVSSRGHTGTVDAVQHVMDAQPGAPLVWVLRHASALGGIEDIDLVSQQHPPTHAPLPYAAI
jgi:membrane-associated protease RseP (regulator of RpoE activity)